MPLERPNALRIAVIGGANTDIVGHSTAALIARDSNPGHARVSPGGVGRNVAENLARLGAEVALVTAFGGDHNAEELVRHAREVGVDTSASLVCEDLPGSVYLAILEPGGDMALALSDMRPLDRLTPSVLHAAWSTIEAADVVVCDANLDPESLEWLTARVEAPLVLDPVSVSKAPRARGVLARLDAVKCNVAEAQALVDQPDVSDPAELAELLVAQGVGRAFVTAGPDGVVAADVGGSWRVAAPAARVENATGAGDAFTAGVAWALAEGAGTRDAACKGSALARLALESADTVSPLVTRDEAERLAREVFAAYEERGRDRWA